MDLLVISYDISMLDCWEYKNIYLFPLAGAVNSNFCSRVV